MIDPRALRMFHEVCVAGSISGAARALNISQPSVSAAIAGLESRLGVVLFERTRAGVVLTPAGEALRIRAQNLDHLLRDAEADVAAVREGGVGALRVGGTPGALVSMLPTGVAGLDRELAHVSLSLIVRSDSELTDMLRSGEIELAFVTTAIEEPALDIAERTLRHDPFALLVAAEHPLSDSPISLSQTEGLRWVLPEAEGGFRRQIEALFLAAGVGIPRDVVRCDSLLAMKAIVRESLRATILPIHVAASELRDGALRAIPLAEAATNRSVGVHWYKPRGLSPLASRLLDLIEHHP
ncbi:LysR family transcriptional regulator [Novosphingobium sp. FSW06-99]|uniref:LysR family transcriptional regulator n=1 Tax=Novosphingobium sp. FSW06-99 TaxID=1739113 RepID=UPI00076BCC26|nr:LysR family transcriptional regulator [Novosphingobium sp. FSW06-99]KUR76364.1 LysR family transcriptional regulator [Novosphingobium sp. FSW06-99]